MRLFAGITLPADINGRLSTLVDYLRSSAHLRWVPPSNFHLTLKFIGEWPEARLEELITMLRSITGRAPVSISISGIGWLPNPHSPRVLFAGVRAEELADAAAAADEAVARLGVARESRDFKPHLTLARIKDSSVPLAPVRQAIARLDNTEFGMFTAKEFYLYVSKAGPAGSIYTQLAEFPFTG